MCSTADIFARKKSIQEKEIEREDLRALLRYCTLSVSFRAKVKADYEQVVTEITRLKIQLRIMQEKSNINL